MRALMLIPLAALATACTVVDDVSEQAFPAVGIHTVRVDLDRGAASYQGRSTRVFDVTTRTWGESLIPGDAERNHSATRHAEQIEGGSLSLWGTSDYAGAGVDFDVTGPSVVDLEIRNAAGAVSAADAHGSHLLEGSSVQAARLSGSVDLYARTGTIDASLYPDRGDVVRVETEGGSVRLELPFGLDYSLNVWGDADYELSVEDLGFHRTMVGAGTFAASTGPGTVQVDVFAQGGSVTIVAGR